MSTCNRSIRAVRATLPGLLLFLGTLVAGGGAKADDGEIITVSWRSKPPYHYVEKGIEKGFLLEKAKLVFSRSGIPAKFVEEPAKRIWAQFAKGMKSYCSIGWYRLPERETMVQYSTIFYSDRPHAILVSPASVDKVLGHRSLASLMSDTALTLGVVDGVSYGPILDKMITASRNLQERKTVDPIGMSRMVRADRADYMLIDEPDLLFLRGQEGTGKPLHQLSFPDMPPGLNRYITCSKDVSADTMKKLNKAIDASR